MNPIPTKDNDPVFSTIEKGGRFTLPWYLFFRSLLTVGRGTQWRNGVGAPLNSLGVDGDYYLEDLTLNVYRRDNNVYAIVGAWFPASPNIVTSAAYTLVLADANKILYFTNASPVTVTVPPHSDVPIPVNSQLELVQFGAGQVSFVGGAGVLVHSVSGNISLAAQYAGATLIQESLDEWFLIGNLGGP